MSDAEKIATLEQRVERLETACASLVEAIVSLWGVNVVKDKFEQDKYLEDLDRSLTETISLLRPKNG